jgi:hypothetical protein
MEFGASGVKSWRIAWKTSESTFPISASKAHHVPGPDLSQMRMEKIQILHGGDAQQLPASSHMKSWLKQPAAAGMLMRAWWSVVCVCI